MAVKIKVSYENDQERDQILRMLRPAMTRAKVKDKRDKKPYKTVYIELAGLI
jgi:hypothetical protein